MDARRRPFLTGLIDHEADRFDASSAETAMTAISNGVLRGPSAHCTYITTVRCDDDLRIAPGAEYRVELDMFVAELAGLDLRFAHLERELERDRALSTLWIDDEIVSAWAALDQDDDFVIDAGRCVFVGHVAANGQARMQSIVALMTAVAGAPVRRIEELAAALERFGRLHVPARLRIDGDALLLAGPGSDIAVGVASAAGAASAGSQLRTQVRASCRGVPALTVVDAAADRKHRPPGRHRFVELEAGGRRWLSTEAQLPVAVSRVLESAQPTAVVVTDEEVIASIGGWLVDPVRLGAAVEFVRALANPPGEAPYR